MSDYISRADAIDAVCREICDTSRDKCETMADGNCGIIQRIDSLPSADAVPTVIRAKTFMRKEDFDKWAEDIKKQNKSIVCIPCDAEVVSAEPIERISDNTIVVKYADYEDIGRIILTNGDIFCKMFYEDARQNDDSDYINDIPEYCSWSQTYTNMVQSALFSSADAEKGGDAKMDNCQAQAPQNYMQQSRHDDGRIEVVRCKDCRHGWYDDDIEYYTCRHPKGLNEELYGVDFCSYGERREP